MEKDNSIVSFVEESSKGNVCIKYACSTCGSIPFCRELESVPGFYRDLVDESICSLLRHYNGRTVLSLIFRRILREREDKINDVLTSWMENEKIMEDTYFVDCVLFSVVRNNKNLPAARAWIEYCINLALSTGSESLTESLIYVLGQDIKNFPDFYQNSVSLSRQSNRVYLALGKVGLIIIKKKKYVSPEKSKRATRNIFGAIRRNDIKAVEHILKRRPDLSAVNAEGMTALEYAVSLKRKAIEDIIDKYGRES